MKFCPDIIIHLAASVEVEESVKNPIKYYENNVVNSLRFLDSCIKADSKNIVFSSTAAVYGNSSKKLINENEDLVPESPYGKSKLIIENVLRDLHISNKLNSIIFRYFNVAGADEKKRTGQFKEPASHLIKVACQNALRENSKMYIYGNNYETVDGTCVRDFIHIEDLAEIHLRASKYLLDFGGTNIINCGYGRGFSVLEVINEVKTVSKNNFKVEVVSRRPGDPPQLIADNNLCKKIFNWTPKKNSLKKIILDSFEWEKKFNQN